MSYIITYEEEIILDYFSIITSSNRRQIKTILSLDRRASIHISLKQRQRSLCPCSEVSGEHRNTGETQGGEDPDLQGRLTVNTAFSPLVINFQMILSTASFRKRFWGCLIGKKNQPLSSGHPDVWLFQVLCSFGDTISWGVLFSFSISISPHTSVKCKINLLAAKIKLISKQWWRERRQGAALEATERNERPAFPKPLYDPPWND